MTTPVAPDRVVDPAPRWRRTDGAALVALFLLVALFFWRIWTPSLADRVAYPSGDFTEQYFPLRRAAALSLAEGRLPFWNPYIFGGQPGLADPQAAVLYPPTLLNALLWGGAYSLLALELEVIAHVAFAAVGTYLFIRRGYRLAPFPSFFGAVVFGFGGYLVGFPVEQVTILAVSSWMPWLLLAIRNVVRRDEPRVNPIGVASGAFCIGMALLAGHPQTALYVLYVSLAYAALRFYLASTRFDATPGWWRRPVVGFLLMFILGAGLAAAQLLSTAQFIAESSRQALNYEFVSAGLGWDELTLLIMPKVIGSTPLYVGIPTLLLIPLGLRSRGERADKRFWGATALLALLLSLGGNSFLFDIVYLIVPGIEQVRSQERVLQLWSWSLALLAAWGIAWLLEPSSRRRSIVRRYTREVGRFLPVVLLPLLLLWVVRALAFSQISINLQVLDAFFGRYSHFFLLFTLSWGLFGWGARRLLHRRTLLFSGLLLLLLLWDLFSINRNTHLGAPYQEALPPRTPVVDALYAWQATAPARVEVVGTPLPRSNDGMRWGFPMLSGNEPLQLAVTERFLAAAQPWNRLQALNAQYIVSDMPLHLEDPEAYELLASADAPAPSYLIRVRPPMPYAWLVGRTEQHPSGEAIREELAARVRDLHEMALVETPLRLSGQSFAPGENVEVRERGTGGAIRVENPGDAPVLLVIAEVASKGWSVSVNGEPVEWLPANGINLAVPVPPGEHIVELDYTPPGWRAGLLLSGSSATAILFLLLAALYGSKHPPAYTS